MWTLCHYSVSSRFLCVLFVVKTTPWWHETGVFTISAARIQIQECCCACSKWSVCEKPGTKYIIGDQKWTPTCVWLGYGLCARVFSPAWGAGEGKPVFKRTDPFNYISFFFLMGTVCWTLSKGLPAIYCSSIVLVEASVKPIQSWKVARLVFFCPEECFHWNTVGATRSRFFIRSVLHNSARGVIKPTGILVLCARTERCKWCSALWGRKKKFPTVQISHSDDTVTEEHQRGSFSSLIDWLKCVIRISNFIMTFEAKGSF